MSETDHYKDNAWSVFFWGLIICLLLAFVVYLIG